MLPYKNKLKPNEIPLVARKGSRHHGEYFDIKVVQDKTLLDPKLAISVSVKVSKRATMRNRMKRLVREALRELITAEKLTPAKYLIMIKTEGVADATPSEIAETITAQLNKN